jgi:hypothetical protein
MPQCEPEATDRGSFRGIKPSGEFMGPRLYQLGADTNSKNSGSERGTLVARNKYGGLRIFDFAIVWHDEFTADAMHSRSRDSWFS